MAAAPAPAAATVAAVGALNAHYALFVFWILLSYSRLPHVKIGKSKVNRANMVHRIRPRPVLVLFAEIAENVPSDAPPSDLKTDSDRCMFNLVGESLEIPVFWEKCVTSLTSWQIEKNRSIRQGLMYVPVHGRRQGLNKWKRVHKKWSKPPFIWATGLPYACVHWAMASLSVCMCVRMLACVQCSWLPFNKIKERNHTWQK